MQSENLIRCAHAPCRCLVETEDLFCSAVCASSKDKHIIPCPCGHQECAESEQAVEIDDEFEAPADVY